MCDIFCKGIVTDNAEISRSVARGWIDCCLNYGGGYKMAKTGRGNELECETLEAKIDKLVSENKKIKDVLATLIVWLQMELGNNNVGKLLDDLKAQR
jgi:hypothetical protein